jgi:hypothetical protein
MKEQRQSKEIGRTGERMDAHKISTALRAEAPTLSQETLRGLG